MAWSRSIPHEVTLVAIRRETCGNFCILDIVETSRRNASYFTRRWVKDREVWGVIANAAADRNFSVERARRFNGDA